MSRSVRHRGPIPADAIWLPAPRLVEIRRVVALPPGPNELRLRAVYSAFSHGIERLSYNDALPDGMLASTYPLSPGQALVGLVIDAGVDVADVRAGDLVFAAAPHQTTVTVPAGRCLRLPRGLDPLLGVLAGHLQTAVATVQQAPPRLGERAVVVGLGGVGLLTGQMLKRAGAARVCGIDPLARRRAAALASGIDEARVPAEAAEAGGRHGFDLVVEASGDTAALRAAIDLAADGGTVAISSWYARHAALPPLGARFHQGAVTLVAIDEAAPSPAPRWPRERRMALIRDLLPRLRLRDLISHRLRFAEGPAAYDLIDRFPGETVVVALSYAEEHWQAETDADDGDGDGQAGGLSQIASEPHGNG